MFAVVNSVNDGRQKEDGNKHGDKRIYREFILSAHERKSANRVNVMKSCDRVGPALMNFGARSGVVSSSNLNPKSTLINTFVNRISQGVD